MTPSSTSPRPTNPVAIRSSTRSRTSTAARAQTFVTVEVDPDAPLSYPVAQDTVLTASDVADRDDRRRRRSRQRVLRRRRRRPTSESPCFPTSSRSAELLSDKRVRVRIGDESQIIPFSVSHPDDDDIRSYAFIWVPGYSTTRCRRLDRTAPLLTVASEETLPIDLNDYVITLGGQRVRLTDSSTVRATHSNGDKPRGRCRTPSPSRRPTCTSARHRSPSR